jgi:thiamine biosynthesis lipoprotein
MGTTARITAVPASEARAGQLDAALETAEAELRRVEARMSSWLDASELSALNRAAPGQPVPLSRETLDVLRTARSLYERTGGAFDATCGPLIDLWRAVAESGRLPERDALARARALGGWAGFELGDGEARRTEAGARIDLGGIAKGYGIDRATGALREAPGVHGGMVDVGGDVRVFGASPSGEAWRVGLRSPREGEGAWGSISVSEGAVCTSGHYARYAEIGGRRYSHIIDPRTGRPAETASLTVTVLAPTAIRADAWATALSVLGPAGLEQLAGEPGVEALVVHGNPEQPRAAATAGFPPVEDLGGFPSVERRQGRRNAVGSDGTS